MYRKDWFDKFMDVSLKTFIFLLFAGFWLFAAFCAIFLFVHGFKFALGV